MNSRVWLHTYCDILWLTSLLCLKLIWASSQKRCYFLNIRKSFDMHWMSAHGYWVKLWLRYQKMRILHLFWDKFFLPCWNLRLKLKSLHWQKFSCSQTTFSTVLMLIIFVATCFQAILFLLTYLLALRIQDWNI